MLETRPFDPAEYIRTREEAGFYIEAALADGDTADVVDALDVVARALQLAEPHLATDAGFEAIGRALKDLGLRFAVQDATDTAAVAA